MIMRDCASLGLRDYCKGPFSYSLLTASKQGVYPDLVNSISFDSPLRLWGHATRKWVSQFKTVKKLLIEVLSSSTHAATRADR